MSSELISLTNKVDVLTNTNLKLEKQANLNFDKVLLLADGIEYRTYPGEHLIDSIMSLMKEELSEPYPIFTYRYFLNESPDACIMAYDQGNFLGCIIGKCETNKKAKLKGYIAMIAVNKKYRGKKIGKKLVDLFIKQMKQFYNAHEIYLETEVTNTLALCLYEGFGFIRTKRLFNYYLNGNSAFRLKLSLREFISQENEA
jgi:peptide alpha-N-acetyltransferase